MKTTSPPDLQELVAAAGGYDKITPEMWAAFDRAMDVYQQERREGLANDPALAVSGVPERTWPYARCADCGGEAHFGYLDSERAMRWFCAAHRLARWWADARR